MADQPVLIAHRGASGYLPEHTLPAATYAYALGADYIEQDVVMSRDDVLIVLHDIHLDTTTNVAERFPDRARADGRFYAIDFTWDELQTLTVRERFRAGTGKPVFPSRFPHNGTPFRLCTMEDQIRLVQGLNASTGRTVGIYPEIKQPAWHRREGKDPGPALIALLARYGYSRREDQVIVQCFDADELKRLRARGSELTFVLLLDSSLQQSAPETLSPAGLQAIAQFAQGIGPHLPLVLPGGPAGPKAATSLVADAHAAGLVVHPYTLRADQLPDGWSGLAALADHLFARVGADGAFIDHLTEVQRD